MGLTRSFALFALKRVRRSLRASLGAIVFVLCAGAAFAEDRARAEAFASSAIAVPPRCDKECTLQTSCSTPCWDPNEGRTITCGQSIYPCSGQTTCDDVCTSTTACNTPCLVTGVGTTCGASTYSCTEKNTERTYLFSFSVLDLNTWLLPGFGGFGSAPDRECRGPAIGRKLSRFNFRASPNYSVVMLQEAFDANTNVLFCTAFAAGACQSLCEQIDSYIQAHPWLEEWCANSTIRDAVAYPYHIRHKPPGKGAELNGGLAALSVFPISFQHNAPWNDCGNADCFAQKGFLHFRVTHPSMSSPLDFVTLHTNANYHEPGKTNFSARKAQLTQLYREMERYPNSTFVLAGDFNIVGPPCHGAACDDEPEYFQVLRPAMDLNFTSPSRDAFHFLRPQSAGFTADECTNTNRSLNCATGRRERIDYMWYNDSNNCYELEATSVAVDPFTIKGCPKPHLSDHYGVVATFDVWKKAGANNCRPPDPDGGVDVGAPPVFEPLAAEHVAYVGETLVLTAAANEGEGDWTEISASGLPQGATFTNMPGAGRSTAEVTWTPEAHQLGRSALVVFKARDARGARGQATTTLRASCRTRLSLAPPLPPGPYEGTEQVTVSVGDACGDGLQLAWRFKAWQGAGYTVISGCESGPLNLANATSCTIRLNGGATAALRRATTAAPISPLAPEKSVDVIVEGRDAAGNFVSDRINLDFVNHAPVEPQRRHPETAPVGPRIRISSHHGEAGMEAAMRQYERAWIPLLVHRPGPNTTTIGRTDSGAAGAGETALTEYTVADPARELPGIEKNVWAVSFVSLARHLIECIRSGKPLVRGATFEDGLRCQAVMDAVRRSAAERRWVAVGPG
jgi:endonuclease/exonuclease/phosphatase family metal-dependent hydrolase